MNENPNRDLDRWLNAIRSGLDVPTTIFVESLDARLYVCALQHGSAPVKLMALFALSAYYDRWTERFEFRRGNLAGRAVPRETREQFLSEARKIAPSVAAYALQAEEVRLQRLALTVLMNLRQAADTAAHELKLLLRNREVRDRAICVAKNIRERAQPCEPELREILLDSSSEERLLILAAFTLAHIRPLAADTIKALESARDRGSSRLAHAVDQALRVK